MSTTLFHINSKNGLPNEQVHAADLDKFGRIWLAGPVGLSCYNGNSIEVFDSRNGINCIGLRTVYIHKDTVWIGTDRGIEAMTTSGSIINLNLTFEWIYGIAESFLQIDNILWVGSSFGLLKLRFEKNNLHQEDVYEVGLAKQIVRSSQTQVLVNTANKGFLVFENNKLIKNNNEEFPETISNVYGNRIIKGFRNELQFLNLETEDSFSFKLNNNSGYFTAITQLNKTIYAGFHNTLFILEIEDENQVKIAERIDMGSLINNILIDKFSNVWVSTNNKGLIKVPAIRKAIKKVSLVKNDSTFCIKTSSHDKKYLIGGIGFATSVINLKKEFKTTNHTELSSIVWDIIEDPKSKNAFWYATQDGLYYGESELSVTETQPFENIIKAPCRVLLSRNQEIWVGTIAGLFKIVNEEIIEILNINGIKFGYVYCLKLDNKNNLLIGTLGQGLWKETSEGIVNIIDDNLTENGNTYSVNENSLGETIIVQQENLILADNQFNTNIVLKEFPHMGWTSCWITNDLVAVGSSQGISIINIRTGKCEKKINLYLDKTDWQFTFTNAVKLINNSTLLCGLNSGFYKVELDNLDEFIIPPEVELDKLTWQNTKPEVLNNYYTLYEGKWSFELTVYSAWFIEETQVKFRYKLVGFDEDWSELSNSNIIKYSSLPQGNYELLVQPYTDLTGYGEIKSLIHLHVEEEVIDTANKTKSTPIEFLNNANKLKNEFLIEQNNLLLSEVNSRKQIEKELTAHKNQLEETIQNRTFDLKKAKEKAEQADSMKSIFLATMSHEIRTPLGGIIGLNNFMLESELNEIQREYTKKIQFTADHLLQIINDILDITKIESGQVDLEKAPFSITTLIEEVAEFSQIKLDEKQIDLIVTSNIHSDYNLIGDSFRIKQVLINLIGNAIKFTENGTISIEILEQESKDETKSLSFSVKDTGIGISKENQKSIFNAFDQAENDTTRKYGGSGLGLNISSKIVKLLGSELSVESSLGLGSKFYFFLSLPYSEIENNLEYEKFETSKTALILDDNKFVLHSLEAILQKFNIKSYSATNTKNCISLVNLANTKFDLAFVDADFLNSSQIDNILQQVHNVVIIGQSSNTLQLKFKKENKYEDVLLKPITFYKINAFINDWRKKIPETQKIEIAEVQKNEKTQATNSYKILIAEDNEINQIIIEKQLKDRGHQVTIVPNGKACIDALELNPNYDLILMDMQMPVMDGITATKHIREVLKNDIPIIALTADVTIQTQSNFSSYGMSDYLSKPVKKSHLYDKIESLLKLD